MKKILLIFILIFSFVFNAKAQFPLTQTLGSPNTQVYSKGGLGADSGFVYRMNFPDTSVLNIGFLKNIPGLQIRVGDNIWMRNNAATAWIKINGVAPEYFARNDARNNTGNDMYFSAAGYNLVIDSIKGEGDSYNRYIDGGNNFDYITGFYGGNSFYQITAINNSSSFFSTIELQPTGVNISSTEYGSRIQVSDSLVLKTPHFSSDTTKYKPLAIDSIGNSIRMNYWPSGGGSITPGIDDVLAIGQSLTTNRSIDQNGNNFFLLGGGNFRVYDAAGTNRLLEIDKTGTSGFIGNGTGSKQFSFTSDSLFLIGLGQKIDTTIWKPTVRNINTGSLAYSSWIQGISDSIYNIINNKKNIENPYGLIYNDSLWNNSDFINDFSVNGSTSSDSSGVLILTGGTSSFDKTLDININQKYNIKPYYTNLEDWVFEIKAQVITHGVLPIGIRSYVSNNPNAIIYGYINTSTGQQLLYSGNVINSTTSIPVNIGDFFTLRVERHGMKMSMTFRNITTNSATVTLNGAISNSTPAPPVTGKFSLFAYTGKFYIDSIGIESNVTSKSSLAIIGDSKSQLYPSQGGSQKRWSSMISGNMLPVVHAGRAEGTADWLLSLPEVLSLKPQQVILAGVSNDTRFLVNLDSTKSRYYRIERQLRDSGIQVYHLDGIYETAQNNQPWATYINQSRSPDSVIQTYSATSVPGTLEPDGVHPNNLGNTIIYNRVVNSGKIRNGINTYASPSGFISNLFTTEPSQYASINIIGDYKQIGNIDQTGGAKFGTGAAATSLTDLFKIHTNTSNYTYIYSNATVGNALIWGNASGAAAANLQAGSYYGSSHRFRTVTSGAYNDALYIGANGLIGAGTSSPAVQWHINASTTSTNTVAEVMRISLSSTGVAAAGLGIRELKEMRNASGVFKSLAYIDWIQTDATNLSEDADMSVSLFRNGTPTEALRVLSTGELSIKRILLGADTDSILVQDNGVVKYISASYIGTNIQNASSPDSSVFIENGLLTKALLAGTSNQITLTPSNGLLTFSLPQNIHTSATPQFLRIGIGAASSATSAAYITGTTSTGLEINGTWTTGSSLSVGGSISPSIGNNGSVTALGGAITESSSGNHSLLANVILTAPIITGGSATVTNTANLYINNALATTVTGGNYALFVDDGTTRLDGGLNLNIRTVTGTITAAEDFTILCDATSGAITINLPAASTVTGRIYNVKKIDNSINTVTIDPNSTETIDGAATNVISTQWTNVQFQSNGTNWFIL